MTNGAALTAHEATIQTASVEIQTLRVGKKQVTMGMFRQLPRAVLLDYDTLQLHGVPWGHVNYWWDGDGSQSWLGQSGKLHVVWQLGDTLQRGIVYQTPHGEPLDALNAQYRRLVSDWAILQVACAEDVIIRSSAVCEIHLGKNGPYLVTLNHHEPHILAHYWGTHAARGRGYSADSREEAAEDYAALLHELGLADRTPEMVGAGLAAVASARDAYTTKWAKQWQVLSALPQLYIAV
jgi:hypothetical protein